MEKYIFILLMSSTFLFSGRGDLISTELLSTKNINNNQIFVNGELSEALNLDPVQYGFYLYKIIYETIDINGNYHTASGSISYPRVDWPLLPNESFPLISYQHGTVIERSSVTSEQGEWILPAYLSGSGYVYLEPDYLGLGDSEGMHPYQIKEPYGTAVVDLIRAAKQFDGQNSSFHINEQLFLAGYSEGGYATMAVHQIIERDYSEELTITASFPSAGAYSMSEIMVDVMLAYEPYGEPFYFPYVLFSYLDSYPEIGTVEEYLLPEYLFLSDMFDGYHSSLQINDAMPSVPITIMIPDSIQSFESNVNHPLKLALMDNDLYDWTPDAPMYIFHGIGDELVPYENSQLAYDYFIENGADEIYLELIPENYGGHQDVAPWALLGAFQYASDYQEISCLVESDCAGICGGNTLIDECGICGGDGVDTDEDGICDDEDSCIDVDNDLECDDIDDCVGNVFDNCGICNGDNSSCEFIGDMNSDGQINIIDVVLIVDVIFNYNYNNSADVNQDSSINIYDIVLLVEIILDN